MAASATRSVTGCTPSEGALKPLYRHGTSGQRRAVRTMWGLCCLSAAPRCLSRCRGACQGHSCLAAAASSGEPVACHPGRRSDVTTGKHRLLADQRLTGGAMPVRTDSSAAHRQGGGLGMEGVPSCVQPWLRGGSGAGAGRLRCGGSGWLGVGAVAALPRGLRGRSRVWTSWPTSIATASVPRPPGWPG